MALKEKMDLVVETLKSLKESWVESNPENTDLLIYLHFWRGEELVATVQTQLDRDVGLNAARLASSGFNCDTASITFESYFSHLKESPLTGEHWMHKEMQFVAETVPDAFEKGWVNECVTTSIHDREGNYGLSSLPYLIKDGKVEWQEETFHEVKVADHDSGTEAQGLMFEVMQEAMRQPTIIQSIQAAASSNPTAKMMLGLVTDEEVRMYHTDMATFRALTERDLAVTVILHAEKGSVREQLINERLAQ